MSACDPVLLNTIAVEPASIPDSIIDWRFAAAATELGREIFMARKAAYDCTEQWAALTAAKKSLYIEQAAAILRANRPADILPMVTK